MTPHQPAATLRPGRLLRQLLTTTAAGLLVLAIAATHVPTTFAQEAVAPVSATVLDDAITAQVQAAVETTVPDEEALEQSIEIAIQNAVAAATTDEQTAQTGGNTLVTQPTLLPTPSVDSQPATPAPLSPPTTSPSPASASSTTAPELSVTPVTSPPPAQQSNSPPSSPASVLATGGATAGTLIEQNHNTTIIGSNGQLNTAVVSSPSAGNLDLRGTAPSPPNLIAGQHVFDQPTAITISNQATLSAVIDQLAQTGNNHMEVADAALLPMMATGDAQAVAAVITTANTTLVGHCFRFDITTVLSPVFGDIWLPNEEDYLYCNSPPVTPTVSAIDNQVATTNEVSSQAETGGNTGSGIGEISTGSAATQTTVLEKLNETWLANQWALLRIYNPTLLASLPQLPNAASYQQDNVLYYWWQPLLPTALPTPNQSAYHTELSKLRLHIDNEAFVSNLINQLAQTGNNNLTNRDQTGGTLSTGNAVAQATIINYLNTTIVGSNWYLSDLNLLAPVSGSVTTAKPDLAVEGVATAAQLYPGQTVELHFLVQNRGTSASQPTGLSLALPKGVEVVGTSHGGQAAGSAVEWSVPGLKNGEGIIFTVRLRATHTAQLTAAFTAAVSYSLTELSTANNSVILTIQLLPVAAGAVVTKPVVMKPVTQTVTQIRYLPRTVRQPLIRYVYRPVALPRTQVNPPQVLGAALNNSPNPPAQLLPVAQAQNGVPRLSYCATHLGFCQALRFSFWSLVGLGLSSTAYRRYRKIFGQSSPSPFPRQQ